MIQVVVMDGKKFINEHRDFADDDRKGILFYVSESLSKNKNSIIEISKWINGARPFRRERK